MNPYEVWEWLCNACQGFVKAGEWMVTPLSVTGVAPLGYFTFGGLTIFLAVAIVKWAVF